MLLVPVKDSSIIFAISQSLINSAHIVFLSVPLSSSFLLYLLAGVFFFFFFNQIYFYLLISSNSHRGNDKFLL